MVSRAKLRMRSPLDRSSITWTCRRLAMSEPMLSHSPSLLPKLASLALPLSLTTSNISSTSAAKSFENLHLDDPHLNNTHLNNTHLNNTHLNNTHLNNTHLDNTHLDNPAQQRFRQQNGTPIFDHTGSTGLTTTPVLRHPLSRLRVFDSLDQVLQDIIHILE
ncbi:hypothetical protein HBH98_208460 [Parastagonospora nodorum]|nr:hypothetical protein HBH51_130490 [Parastagonospora nodorum]KAH4076971.1 hypothetical protein HBH50_013100 [Parastagonospora nodorum]KAH4095549.1 hypothetical protein HBH48_044710 [Parastagonospora nodorum]KAH4118767.1 hypothetical protein HBH47_135010 [Parastagonospora nodorum]KAH4163099.1 hypothetical protein HBH43_160730 [Parastagonospora nodorum]